MQWMIENQSIDSLDIEHHNNFLLYSSPVVSSSARGLMMANNLLEYNEPYLEPDLIKILEVRKPRLKPVNQENAYLKVYPNPAKDFVTIEYNTGNDKTNGVIEIIEESGRRISFSNLTKQFDQIILDISHLNTTNYVVKLMVGDKIAGSSKLVVSK